MLAENLRADHLVTLNYNATMFTTHVQNGVLIASVGTDQSEINKVLFSLIFCKIFYTIDNDVL